MRGYFGTNNKFGASKVIFNGIEFDSRYERDRYIYLMDLQKKGEISCLRLQPKFILIPKVTKMVQKELKTKVKDVERVIEKESSYHADFLYIENGKYIAEEFKSIMTSKLQDYILRRKLMVQKIYKHNSMGRSQWVFREVIYINKKNIQITDK